MTGLSMTLTTQSVIWIHLRITLTAIRFHVPLSMFRAILPDFAYQGLREAILAFDRQLKGFAMPDAVLTAVESRSSCPVRLPRDARFESSIGGVYPCGEGAGYAGGIMSAAVDGIRVAEAVLKNRGMMEE